MEFRTLQDNSNSAERRTAIIAKELASYDIDIAALSETRFAESGVLVEVGGGYTFYWIGKKVNEPRQAGVGFAIKSEIVKKLTSVPKGVNERLMTLRIPISKERHATFISAYAPTMTNDEETKETFYCQLRETLRKVPFHDSIILLGDFNARVGSDYTSWPGVLGIHGIGKMNSNGLLLLSLCSEFNLVVTNTIFQQKDKHKTSWCHPRSKHWHLLDYVIVRQRDRNSVNTTRAYRGAECWSDHRLIRSKISLKIRQKRKAQKKTKMPRKLNVSLANVAANQEQLSEKITANLEGIDITDNDIENSWKALRDAVYQSSVEVLGFVRRKHHDWFDENDPEITQLLEKMHSSHKSWINDKPCSSKKNEYLQCKRVVQTRLRLMKEAWWSNKAREMQEAADTHNMKAFYEGLKTVFGPRLSGDTPLLSEDGSKLLTDKEDILKRWAEHFNSVLNRESLVDPDAVDSIPQRLVLVDLASDPTIAEVITSVNQLSNGKSPGQDGIPAEIYKCGGEQLIKKLTALFVDIWSTGAVPQQFKDASIVHLYKNKGKKVICDNHRGISLLAIAGKILARIILNRVNKHLIQSVYPESQCGFRAGRGTVDMIFALRQIQEKSRECGRDLFMVFIDLTKAFDTVSRDALWKILLKLGIPEKMLKVIISFHDGMFATVQSAGQLSLPFNVTNGTKQGCVLAPVLFALFFSVMLRYAYQDCEVGVKLQFRSSGGLFNQQRFKAKTICRAELIRELLFADDCALVSHSLEEMQDLVNRFAKAANAFGLTISIKKTELVHQPPSNADQSNPVIYIDGMPIKTTESFIYLGSKASANARIDDDITLRIGKASNAFGKLTNRLWKSHDISLNTKVHVYRAVVLTTLLYSCGAWTLYREQVNRLDAFHMRSLRSIANIKWEEKITNAEVLNRCGIRGMEAFLIRAQMRWAGHVIRMDESRIPKIVLYSQLLNAKRRIGRPLLRYKDKVKENLKRLNFDPNNWEHLPLDRAGWRKECGERIRDFEVRRLYHRKSQRKAWKARQLLPVGDEHVCVVCNFHSRSKAGLANHSKIHRVVVEEAEWKCSTCQRPFKSKRGLSIHQSKNKHNV